MAEKKNDDKQPTRRELLRAAVYVTPVILTLAATPAIAKTGSRDKDWDDGWD